MISSSSSSRSTSTVCLIDELMIDFMVGLAGVVFWEVSYLINGIDSFFVSS
jgi:hypothetical protein